MEASLASRMARRLGLCCRRARRFQPVATTDSDTNQSPQHGDPAQLAMAEFTIDNKGKYQASLWILVALGLLFVSNVLYFVSFLTNGWGTVKLAPGGARAEEEWVFGMWQCCRTSDGVCLGSEWPQYYSAARAFAVMGLFGHVLAIAWMVGYTLEKLLEYDPCTLGCLVSLCFSTAAFVLIQVCCFGALFPTGFSHELNIESHKLSYSFILATLTVFLMLGAGMMGIVEIRTSLLRLEMSHTWSQEGREPDVLYLNKKRDQKVSFIPLDQLRSTQNGDHE